MAFRVLPYRAGSRGASSLANALPGGRCLRLRNSTWRPRANDIVINWGNTDLGIVRQYVNGPARVLNGMDLRGATNKLAFFRAMEAAGCGDIIPDFWDRREDIPDEVFRGRDRRLPSVVCRTVLAGHSGEGIVLARTREDLVRAPLFVKYIKKQQEYRIHVGRTRDGQSIIIAQQRKARNRAVADEAVNWQVRNHQNGFVFVREGFTTPRAVLDAAQRALRATGLDFGAVDVIFNERSGQVYVLEINTAPGLEGQTVDDYARFFQTF